MGRALSSLMAGMGILFVIFAGLPAFLKISAPRSTIAKLESARRFKASAIPTNCGPAVPLPLFFPPPPIDTIEETAVEVAPRAIRTTPPRVPANLRKLGLRGTVKVQFTVDTQGRVVSPSIISTPNPALNQPTLDAIKQWRFEPGTRGGKRVPMKTLQPFTYG